ncbi:24-methylenesterol C-methyltransferase [Apostasia shenzhenica]|uniref:24-methylenesterol C-methyltransferase n=1 Tax=Apostasia shenzhenica TaxID=1088818 RepID=A0A2I0AMJ1_9ASPA|nr:24-methylenesterol C-methyltransferase [Apostasia shenzhenica]
MEELRCAACAVLLAAGVTAEMLSVAGAGAFAPRSSLSSSTSSVLVPSEEGGWTSDRGLPRFARCCPCGRRHLLGASAAAAAESLLQFYPVKAVNGLSSNSDVSIKNFRPGRPDWYEEIFAKAMEEGMRSYEAVIAAYKTELFGSLTVDGKKVLELGVGTGPNFKYYANASDLDVLGIDPNKKIEKYARAEALAAGLPSTKFTFMQGVGEALPVEDGSIDLVIGTLVLCSVKDVKLALKEVKRVLKADGLYLFIEHVAAYDGSLLRLMQSILDPFQQFVADGCHLTRETGNQISRSGFSKVNLNMASVPIIPIVSPHVYGIACK